MLIGFGCILSSSWLLCFVSWFITSGCYLPFSLVLGGERWDGCGTGQIQVVSSFGFLDWLDHGIRMLIFW